MDSLTTPPTIQVYKTTYGQISSGSNGLVILPPDPTRLVMVLWNGGTSNSNSIQFLIGGPQGCPISIFGGENYTMSYRDHGDLVQATVILNTFIMGFGFGFMTLSKVG